MARTKKSEANVPQKEVPDEKKASSKEPEFYQAIGRRKSSTARVRLYTVIGEDGIKTGSVILKRGDFVINDRSIEEYFRAEIYKKLYLEPFRTTNTLVRFATSIKVKGGGTTGQLGAVVHGISRALLQVDSDKFKPILKKRGFLTRDPREKERRNAGFAGKARKRKQSPKR